MKPSFSVIQQWGEELAEAERRLLPLESAQSPSLIEIHRAWGIVANVTGRFIDCRPLPLGKDVEAWPPGSFDVLARADSLARRAMELHVRALSQRA